MSVQIPILTVTTNESSDLEQWLKCVESLASANVTPVPCIADNASSDATAGVIWKAIRSGQVSQENVLWLHTNRGFPSAQNQLIRHLGIDGQYRWFATLNIDAWAESNWLCRLVDAAKKEPDDHVGMWGGLILVPRDSGERVSSAGHALRKDGAFLDIDWNRDPKRELFSDKGNFEPFCPCFAAGLWSIAMVEEAGLPDSGQFLYYDDVELAFKARLLGWRAAFVRDAIAQHPLPNSKKTIDRQRFWQLRGKLLMVLRYLPDQEARAVLVNLSEEERALVGQIDARDRCPFLDDACRASVYRQWADKWISCKNDG